jgi:hypothetical protein
MTRRFFLVSSLGLLFFPQKTLSQSHKEITDEAILKNLLEVLIPSDDTPGAKEAHVYEKLIALLSTDLRKKKIFDDGLLMVRKNIATKPLDVIDWDIMAQSISRSPFFRFLRWDTMQIYYSDKTSWAAVGYEGPPLVGYKNYNTCSS